ncbi:unnamed protein product [Blepharisma stoltei]|uniref:Uncharacterized protein n=1 Tax=Blepharisma stoltei TaxID=1481888 RepID=A0AAU9IVI0_9CILI|nr:unnamed protein product [Blepharisma stoltei]
MILFCEFYSIDQNFTLLHLNMNISCIEDQPPSITPDSFHNFKKLNPKTVFKSQLHTFSKPQRIKGFQLSAGPRSSSISPMNRFLSTEQSHHPALSSRKLEKELREINCQLNDENFPPRINSTFDQSSLLHNKFKMIQKPYQNPKYNEVVYLNKLCNHLIEEQNKLKIKLAQQEDIIEGMKGKSSTHGHPLKLFQEAVNHLEKERKIRQLSARRSATPRKRSIIINHNSACKENPVNLSLNLKGIKKDDDELFTFRPKSPTTPNKGAFPREVFRRIKNS